ncbi:hypothetical protein GM182_06590 [bacterium 3DAC]|nr:hypothetical protein GM182_06590 [bacterium 3DAC]
MKVVGRRGLLKDVFDIKYHDGYFYLAASWRDPVDGESMRSGLVRLHVEKDLSTEIEYLLSGKEAYKVEISNEYLVLSGTGLWIYARRGDEFIPLKEEIGTLVVDVKLVGNLVLAVVGSVFSTYLVVYEITPHGVEDVGIFFDENMSGLFVIGDTYVAVRSGSDVIILDISDPSNIRQVDRYDDAGILLASQSPGIAVLKKDNSLKLYKLPEKKYLGMVKDIGDVVSSFIDGYSLYVLKNTGEIMKFSPGDDRCLFKVDGFPTTVYEHDGVILVGFENEGLLLWRDSKQRWVKSFSPWYGAIKENDRLLLGAVEGAVELDISKPEKPSEISRVKGFWAWHLEKKDDYIYVGGIWSSRGGENIIKEFFKGRILYKGIVILKKNNDVLTEVSRIRLPETKSSFTTYDVYIKDNLLFAVSDAGMIVMDISTPEEPKVVYEKRGIHVKYVWFEDDTAYIHLYPSGDVIVFHISGDDIQEVQMVHDVGYIKIGYKAFGGRSGVRYISTSDEGLKIIGGLDVGMVEDGITDGRRLYVSSYHEDKHKLWIIDGSNVEEYEVPHLKNLLYRDGYLYASAQVGGKEWDIVKYDVSRGLKEVERIEDMGDIFNYAMWVGDYMYFLDGRRGVAILEV